MPKVTTTYFDDDKEARMLFSNGTYLMVHYKYIKDEHIIFHYHFKSMNGGMKIRPNWIDCYDDIMGQAECSLPHLFMPSIFKYFYGVQVERKEEYEIVLSLWNEGKIKEIKDRSWSAYWDFNEKRAKEMRKDLNRQKRILKELNNITYECK